MTANITLSDLQLISDEPRLNHRRVAERLGTRQQEIARLIERNRAEMEMHGGVCVTVTQTSVKGGRPGQEFWLNEPQILLLCMFSRTEAAALVRQEVINVYMAYRKRLPPHQSAEGGGEVMKALLDGIKAREELIMANQRLKRCADKTEYVRILIRETALNDNDIADKMKDVLGGYIPEWVAWQRRQIVEGGQ